VQPQVSERTPSSACQPGGDNAQTRAGVPEKHSRRLLFQDPLRKHFDLTPGHRLLLGFDERTDDIALATDTRLQRVNGIDWR
jgi:hypothetical protein